jgi:hypothetical protein
MTTLKGTLDGRPFAARSAILVALNTITQEATINITEYETTCDAGGKFADGSTTVQLTVPWKAGPRDAKDRKPSALFGVRRDGTWKMRSVFDVAVDVLSAPPGTGPSALGRIHVKASRDEESIEGDIRRLAPCEK